MLKWFFKQFQDALEASPTLAHVLHDVFTNQVDEYDGVKIFGYIFLVMSGTTFLFLFIWNTIRTGHFNPLDFCSGVGILSAQLISIGATVRIKQPTENQPPPPMAEVSSPANPKS